MLEPMTPGSVHAIHLIERRAGPAVAVDAVSAVAGRGLEGDRYFLREGTFSRKEAPGRHLTLIEAEALEALERDCGIALPPGASRRNLTTRGVALNHLVDRTFTIGGVTLRGIELCEPCGHLERLTEPGVRAGLVHRGGLRAQILEGGTILVGDTVLSP